MNLYAMTFMGQHNDTLRIKPGIVLATDEADAIVRGIAAATVDMPESDGWSDHRVIVVAIPPQLALEGYQLTWHIEATQ